MTGSSAATRRLHVSDARVTRCSMSRNPSAAGVSVMSTATPVVAPTAAAMSRPRARPATDQPTWRSRDRGHVEWRVDVFQPRLEVVAHAEGAST